MNSVWAKADIGHGYYGPKTDDWVRESNPGPTKRSCCKVRESNPGPTRKITCKARGSNPGPTKKIVRTIVHAIAKYDRAHDRKISRAYKIHADAQTSSTWNMSTGRWMTARPRDDSQTDRKTDDGQIVSKMTKHPKRSCSLQNISFSRYHIMYQIAYIFTRWIGLQQYVCRIRTTKCSSCKITW